MDRTCEDQPLETSGIGTHSESTIIYELPEGYETFSAKGVVTRDGGSVVFGVLVDKGLEDIQEASEVKVSFADIGITGKAMVRDLWGRKDLGEYEGSFCRTLPLHGAGLFRVTPVP